MVNGPKSKLLTATGSAQTTHFQALTNSLSISNRSDRRGVSFWVLQNYSLSLVLRDKERLMLPIAWILGGV